MHFLCLYFLDLALLVLNKFLGREEESAFVELGRRHIELFAFVLGGSSGM